MTTIKPETPLPWFAKKDKIAPYSGIYSLAGAHQVTHENGATSDTNAAYIVTACNAYPKLVEALRTAMLTASSEGRAQGKALLRELGELP